MSKYDALWRYLQTSGQTQLTLTFDEIAALAGTALASGVYGVAAFAINKLFSASVTGMEQVCLLLPEHFALAFAAVSGLALLAALAPALRAARVEPSEVIREI